MMEIIRDRDELERPVSAVGGTRFVHSHVMLPDSFEVFLPVKVVTRLVTMRAEARWIQLGGVHSEGCERVKYPLSSGVGNP